MRVIDREGMGGTLILGDKVCLDDSADIDISADVTIGDFAAISDDVLILTHDHLPGAITHRWARPLVIGEGVWIGARVIVTAACNRIGAWSVVGAGSVVTHDIPDRELWAGNPARFIRKLEASR